MIKKEQAKAKPKPKPKAAPKKSKTIAYYETAGTVTNGYKVSRGGVRLKTITENGGGQTRRPAPKGGQTRRFKRRELPAGK